MQNPSEEGKPKTHAVELDREGHMYSSRSTMQDNVNLQCIVDSLSSTVVSTDDDYEQDLQKKGGQGEKYPRPENKYKNNKDKSKHRKHQQQGSPKEDAPLNRSANRKNRRKMGYGTGSCGDCHCDSCYPQCPYRYVLQYLITVLSQWIPPTCSYLHSYEGFTMGLYKRCHEYKKSGINKKNNNNARTDTKKGNKTHGKYKNHKQEARSDLEEHQFLKASADVEQHGENKASMTTVESNVGAGYESANRELSKSIPCASGDNSSILPPVGATDLVESRSTTTNVNIEPSDEQDVEVSSLPNGFEKVSSISDTISEAQNVVLLNIGKPEKGADVPDVACKTRLGGISDTHIDWKRLPKSIRAILRGDPKKELYLTQWMRDLLLPYVRSFEVNIPVPYDVPRQSQTPLLALEDMKSPLLEDIKPPSDPQSTPEETLQSCELTPTENEIQGVTPSLEASQKNRIDVISASECLLERVNEDIYISGNTPSSPSESASPAVMKRDDGEAKTERSEIEQRGSGIRDFTHIDANCTRQEAYDGPDNYWNQALDSSLHWERIRDDIQAPRTSPLNKKSLSEEAQLKKSARGLLNKLSVENFIRISLGLAALYKQAGTMEQIEILAGIICEKAIFERHYGEVYADLGNLLKYQWNENLDVIPAESKRDDLKSTHLFKALINKCQELFKIICNMQQSDIIPEEGGYSDNGGESTSFKETLDSILANGKMRKKTVLGCMKFIGEMWIRRLLPMCILQEIIFGLADICCKTVSPPCEIHVEALVEFMISVGYTLEYEFKQVNILDACMSRIDDLKQNGGYSFRISFMIKDLLELRKEKWVKKAFREKVTTKDAIRTTVKKENEKGGAIHVNQEGRFIRAGMRSEHCYYEFLCEEKRKAYNNRPRKEGEHRGSYSSPPPEEFPFPDDVDTLPARNDGFLPSKAVVAKIVAKIPRRPFIFPSSPVPTIMDADNSKASPNLESKDVERSSGAEIDGSGMLEPTVKEVRMDSRQGSHNADICQIDHCLNAFKWKTLVEVVKQRKATLVKCSPASFVKRNQPCVCLQTKVET